MENKQFDLFNKPIEEDWEKEWKDMPEFIQENTDAYRQIIVSFKDKQSVEDFTKLVEQKLGPKTKSMWFPEDTREKPSLFKYTTKEMKDAI